LPAGFTPSGSLRDAQAARASSLRSTRIERAPAALGKEPMASAAFADDRKPSSNTADAIPKRRTRQDAAVALLLLIRDQEPSKFERAALRWHARFCREAKAIAPGEALAVLALLEMLGGKRGKPAARALSELLYRRGTEPSCEVLVRWANEGGPN
jgi:hypothetical protein